MIATKHKVTRQDTQDRRIPNDEDFRKKSINAKLYGFFQTESYLGALEDNTPVRFIYRNNFRNNDLAALLGITVRQAQRQIKVLKDAGFIANGKVWNKEKTELVDVVVLTENSDKVQYVELETLRELVSAGNKNTIKVYVYLLGWFEHKKKNKDTFIFTKKQLIQYCFGMSSTTHQRDYDAINDILKWLVLVGLIDYEFELFDSPNGHLHTRMRLINTNKMTTQVIIKRTRFVA